MGELVVLVSCGAAFVTGLVIAGMSVFGQRKGLEFDLAQSAFRAELYWLLSITRAHAVGTGGPLSKSAALSLLASAVAGDLLARADEVIERGQRLRWQQPSWWRPEIVGISLFFV